MKIGGGIAAVGKRLINNPASLGAAQFITGTGSIKAAFADGTISTRGAYIVLDTVQHIRRDKGIWDGTGTIAASGNGFSGSLTLDGKTDYTGTWKGRFYGPAAGSVGALFELSGTGGALAAGYLIGAADPVLTSAYVPLLDLTALRPQPGESATLRFSADGAGGYQLLDNKGGLTGNFPAKLQVGLARRGDGGIAMIADGLTVTPAQIIAGQTSPALVTYALTGYGDGYDDWSIARLRRYVFDGQQGRIKLRYADIAEVWARGSGGDGRFSDSFVAFGNQTPATLRPITGKATYNGVLVGRGVQGVAGQSDSYALTGSARLTANFGTNRLAARLAMTGTGLASGKVVDFGSFAIAGEMYGVQRSSEFTGKVTTAGWQGGIEGAFYGPNAEEAGGAFDIASTTANTVLRGVFAATTGQ